MTGKAPDLDAEFKQFNVDRTKVRCATCKLPVDLRAWVDTKITEGSVSSAALSQFVAKKGYVISQTAIVNHRMNHVA